VDVTFNLKNKSVIIKFGSSSFGLPVQGARDVALALRQAANKVEKFAN
jgi:hypothetical protein